MASTQDAILQNIGPAAASGSVTLGRRANWWLRRGSRRRFRYETADGQPVRDEAALERIKSLAIPPAWDAVRISPRAQPAPGHRPRPGGPRAAHLPPFIRRQEAAAQV